MLIGRYQSSNFSINLNKGTIKQRMCNEPSLVPWIPSLKKTKNEWFKPLEGLKRRGGSNGKSSSSKEEAVFILNIYRDFGLGSISGEPKCGHWFGEKTTTF